MEINVSAVSALEIITTLFNESQQEITSLHRPTGQSTVLSQLVGAGQHYLLVRNDFYPAASSTTPYTLSVSLNTSDPNEFNNTFSDATLIGPDEEIHGTIWTRGDLDYYQFQTTGPGLIDVKLLNPPPFYYEILLFDPAQQNIRTIQSNGGVAISTEVNIAEAGTHYLLIRDFASNEGDSRVYSLTISGAIIDESSPIRPGDVGRNGVVDAGDASLALRSIVGLAALSNNQRTAADVDGNQSVQAADASLILQFVVGLIDIFPTEAPGKFNHESSQRQLAWGDVLHALDDDNYFVSLRVAGDSSNVSSAQAKIHFDPHEVDIEDLVLNAPDGWMVFTKVEIEKGVLHLALAGATPASSAQLATLKVHPKSNAANLLIRGNGIVNTEENSLDELDLNTLPGEFTLHQNYPNPFNPVTTIRYDLAEASDVSLSVYNLLGQEMIALVDQFQKAGHYAVSFDGAKLSSGTYIYRLQAGGIIQTRIMTLLK